MASTSTETHTGRDQQFTNAGNSAHQNLKAWMKWARTRIVVEKVMERPTQSYRPLLFTLLDGEAAEALEHLEIDDMAVEDRELKVFAELKSRFPEK